MSIGIRGATVVLAALLGLGGLAFAAVTYVKDRATHDRAKEVFALPDVHKAPRGDRSVLEGIIAQDVPELGHGFVAYIERQHAKNSTRVIGGLLQPLRLQGLHGFVDIVNAQYMFDPWLVRWGHLTREVSPPGWTSGSIIAEGLLRGGAVMAIGRQTVAGGFEAETVVAGNRVTYLEKLERQSEWPFARIWLIAAPFLIAYAVWQGRRLLHAL